MQSPDLAAHRAEALPVLCWREADIASGQPTEEARIFVADFVGDRLDRLIAGFEHLLGLLDPERVYILQRRLKDRSGSALKVTIAVTSAGSR